MLKITPGVLCKIEIHFIPSNASDRLLFFFATWLRRLFFKKNAIAESSKCKTWILIVFRSYSQTGPGTRFYIWQWFSVLCFLFYFIIFYVFLSVLCDSGRCGNPAKSSGRQNGTQHLPSGAKTLRHFSSLRAFLFVGPDLLMHFGLPLAHFWC